MSDLVDQNALVTLCKEVLEESGMTKQDAAALMGVTTTAVYYMVEDPNRSMIGLRVRFLESVGGLTVEGPGFLVEGDRTIPKREVKERLDLSSGEVAQLIHDEELEINEEGEILHASFYRYLSLEDDTVEA